MGKLSSGLLAALRLAVYLPFTFLCMPLQVIFVALKLPQRESFPVWYHRRCLSVFGFSLKIIGTPSLARPCLYAVNHASYLDIIALGAVIPGSFVAKTEVAGWLLFGWLAKLQRTVFVNRRRGSTDSQRDDLTARLQAGDRLILFPEGTSNDGNRVLTFKSALFSVAEVATDPPLTIQPVSIAYTGINGLPMTYAMRPFFAWYGDMDLAPHLFSVAGLGKPEVTMVFHPPVTLADFGKGGRKALAAHCHRQVAAGVTAANAGRLPVQEA